MCPLQPSFPSTEIPVAELYHTTALQVCIRKRLLTVWVTRVLWPVTGKYDQNLRKFMDSNSVYLTFTRPSLTDMVKVAYEIGEVQTFIPRPMRCFKYQQYGHTECVDHWTPTVQNVLEMDRQKLSALQILSDVLSGRDCMKLQTKSVVWKKEWDISKVTGQN